MSNDKTVVIYIDESHQFVYPETAAFLGEEYRHGIVGRQGVHLNRNEAAEFLAHALELTNEEVVERIDLDGVTEIYAEPEWGVLDVKWKEAQAE